ncbi:hypothetical protein JW964_21745 [candidate division KSB1 bacterium]|nr:hypothetical protein [candidate division KSB1 bacterium]
MQKVFDTGKQCQKCVWMMAGIVNYRLCQFDYECEKCEFDQVMRNLFHLHRHRESSYSFEEHSTSFPLSSERDWLNQMVNQYLMHLVDGCPIHLDRCYHPTHLWSYSEKNNLALIGIDSLILKVLEPVTRIILPEIGNNYQEGQLIAWLIRDEKTYPLRSPCAGTVVALNQEPIDSKNNWLFKIDEKGRHQKLYCDNSLIQSLQLTASNIELIREYVFEGIKQHLPDENVRTMADGGALEPDLKRVLGQQKYEELCSRIFQMK